VERWAQIELLFQEALQRGPAERDAWLREACHDDTELEREVASLLANHQEAGDFEPWAAAAAAQLIDGPALKAGQRLGPYEILAPIGKGGMGEVYKARDTRLKRDVAIKMCAAQFSERFEREARVIASLNHPNICQLYDVGPNFLVMELVEGENLAGPLPVETALNYARQIAEGLEAAHEKGIVHRDLKPANVKITPAGVVKVLDFGLAKAVEEPSAAADSTNSPTLTMSPTRAGMILGTAQYMSPEQARGKAVDKRADIWAFGVVLYEMLTGQRLFQGETVSDTLVEVATKEPDWGRIPAAAGRNVQRLLRRCLEKDPKRRLRDIGEAWFVLEEVGLASGLPDAPVQGLRRWMWPGVAALLFVIAALVFFIHLRETPPVAEVVRFQIPGPESNSFLPSPALSPNGRMIAFSARGPAGGNIVWVRSFDALDARALPSTEDAGDRLFWSPDSRFIGFAVHGKLKKVAASGDPPQTLCDIPGGIGRGGAWSRNGVIIFGSQGHGLMRVSEFGGTPSPLTILDSSRENSHSEPAFLRDGQHFVYQRNSGSAEHSGLYLGTLDASPEQQSSKRPIAPSAAVYAPSVDPDLGYLIFVREGSLMAQPFDNRRMELTGEAVRIAEGLSELGPRMFSASENGVLAYRSGSTFPINHLQWFDRTGKRLGDVGEPGFYNSVALSPDGRKVAVTRLPAGARSRGPRGYADIWVYEFTHGTSERLTADPGTHFMAAWSPDGSRLAFASNRYGTFDLYQKASSGVGNEESLLKSSEAKYPYDWSSDGLLYGVLAGQYELWVLPLTGDDRKPRRYLASQFNESQARFSPDGRFIAYTSDGSGKNEVYVQPFPRAFGGKWPVSNGSGNQPQWRHDGKELFYISADSKMMAVDVTTTPVFQSGNPKALFAAAIWGGATGPVVTRYGVTPDGQKFLINTPAADSAAASPITVVLNWQMSLKK
jgi:eukaryotic-like serine/threonine-protein kinase